MKPIAIIAIIAAVVVVGGACAGVAFSGVLNGGTTGPGGDDPVVPTDPVEPTPTETPTETPTPTPTDSSMSYFSPMTSSGGSSSSGSGSSSGNTPAECEHGEWTYSVLEGDKHTKTCGLCQDYSVVEDCSPLDQYVIDEEKETHQQKCEHCKELMGSEATPCTFTKYGSESQYDYKPIEGSKHQKVCNVCNHAYVKICEGASGYPITPMKGELKHSGTCKDCGANYEDGVDCNIVNMTVSATQHHLECEVCGGSDNKDSRGTYTDVTCTWEFKKDDGAYTHTELCKYCDNKQNSNQACTYNTNSATDNLNGTHTIKCDNCGEPQIFECTYDETKKPTPSADETGTHYWICTAKDCGSKKVEDCNSFTYEQNNGEEATHKKFCGVCTSLLNEKEGCTYQQSTSDVEECSCGRTVASVGTVEDLKKYIEEFSKEGAGNNAINILTDIMFESGDDWTPSNVDGYNGADVITVNGNGHSIIGIPAPLFAGGFAGGSGIIINDLTIADSTITSTNTQGSGAFIETVDSMDVITLNKCHLKNSKVIGSRTGGLIGWTSGYSNTNDGAVKTYVTIKDCSVVGSTIENTFSDEGNTPHTESLGAIFGHAGASSWTFTTIENCVIKDNTLIGGDSKTGVILGTANLGEVTISGCTMEGNTVNGEASDKVYGRTSFGTTGKLTIDGVAIN